MSQYNNSAKIFTGSGGGELRISLNNTKQVINATNNKAQYYAELAEKYKNEAKEHRDNAQYYAEQNSDVTFEYIDSVKESLENQIATKQNSGDYALKSDLPTKVSELHNDLEFTTFNAVIPNQQNQENKVLCTDGEKLFWNSNSSYNLFDIKTFDYVLNYEESKGWALQGTYVYKEAVAGSRYGYPDFYTKCLEERNTATATEVTLGENTITMYVNANGHQFYNIADKDAIDSFFNTMGTAWFYGVDTDNERIFLPRNNYLTSYIADGNKTVDVYGNGKTLGLTDGTNYYGIELPQAAQAYMKYEGYNKDLGFTDTGSNRTSLKFLGITTKVGESGITGDVNLQNTQNGMYLYICVGNTVSESAVTNIVDVTTTENDTTPLFTGMYFDFTPNNVSWLRAGQQVSSGGIYTTAYNELVNELVNPKYGLKVINEVDIESGVDYSEYWIINQNDITFRTPITMSNKALSGAVVGNGNVLGLQGNNLGDNLGYFYNASSGEASAYLRKNSDSVTAGSTAGSSWTNTGGIGVTTDATKSGIIAEQSAAQLYFKVANAVENLELLDAGEVLEAVNNVVPNNSALIANFSLPSDEYIDITIGANEATYTMPADGYLAFYGNAPNTSEGGSAGMVNLTLGNFAVESLNIWGRRTACIMPVRKNDQVKINFSNATSIRLYLLQGNKGEL